MPVLEGAGRWVWLVLSSLCVIVGRVALGAWRTPWWSALCGAGYLGGIALVGLERAAIISALVWVTPLLVGAVWSVVNPFSFERRVAAPWRRRAWRRWARKNWDHLARECGLSVRRTRVEKVTRKVRVGNTIETIREPQEVSYWSAPRLSRATTAGNTLSLRVRARIGQTLDEIEAAVPALQVAAEAEAAISQVLSPCEVQVDLVMRDALLDGREAKPLTREQQVAVGIVPAGRLHDGSDWWLQLRNRHTLVVGCSGSGKGSVLWSACGHLAPAVPTGEVQLWGIDLKRGIELAMGRPLFSCMATTPEQAVAVLRELLAVIDSRGRRMAGVSREHVPTPGDPMHVLVIDELAVLTSYGPPDVVKEGSRLLSEVLTQGRALGVVVLACVQDPRKEVVSMRNLFTQTIALRQLTASDTRMVLGEGIAQVAPAHRIRVSQQGTAWMQDDTGHFAKVRADYWPDSLIRTVAEANPSPVVVELPTNQQAAEQLAGAPVTPFTDAGRTRKPRAPRKPRRTDAADLEGQEAA